MSAHTPGPWRKETTRTLDDAPISFLRLDWAIRNGSDDNGAVIAHIPMQDDLILQSEANARLIAAAPDLLAALRNLLDASERYIFSDECLREREAARAAIAKAEGQA
jgi:hypothetical protein